MLNRLRREERGFGLLELLIAMTLLNIGILTLVAGFNSGAVTLKRAAQVSTAAALADRQMELYRAVKYSQIGLQAGLLTGGADADQYYPNSWPYLTASPPALKETSCLDPTKPECMPIQTVTGPDGRSYRIDTYIVQYDFEDFTAVALRKVKVIRVLVRDGSDLGKVLIRQESTFDESTGL